MQTTKYKGQKIELYLSDYNGSWCVKINGVFQAGGFLKKAGAMRDAKLRIDKAYGNLSS